MQGRWWSPARGSTDLDDVTKALLDPGSDDRLDFGATLLALHRAGAAGCKAAAETPLVDEVEFVAKLAQAREQFAPAVVSAVGKSLGDPAYGGLLVADLANDAEYAALTLFRDAVAHGVPRPTAAVRAGEVYGVPLKELGHYRRLATDPKANPAALADAADRAVFTAVEKLVDAEALEPVSKQNGDRPWERERRVPRGQPHAGEWVEVAEATPETEVEGAAPPTFTERMRALIGLPAAPGAEVAEEARIREEQAAQRQQRKQRAAARARARRERARRAVRVRQAVEERRAATASRPQAGQRQAGQRKAGRRQGAGFQVGRSNQRNLPDPRTLKDTDEIPEGMQLVTERVQYPMPYGKLDVPVGFWATTENTISVLGAAEPTGVSNKPWMIRGAHLERLMKKKPDVAGTSSWANDKRTIAEQEWNSEDMLGNPKYADFVKQPERITEDEFSGPVGAARIADIRDRLAGGDDLVDEQLVVLPDTQGGVTVAKPEAPDPSRPEDTPVPHIDDWLIRGAEGYLEAGRNPEVFLDPKQAYAISKSNEFWDVEAQVIRQTYTATPIDEAEVERYRERRKKNVDKADGDAPWERERRIPRGQAHAGEWVRTRTAEEQDEAVEAKPTFEERLASLLPEEDLEDRRLPRESRRARADAKQRRRQMLAQRRRQAMEAQQRVAGRQEASPRKASGAKAGRRQAQRPQGEERPWPATKPKPQGRKPVLRDDGRYTVLSPKESKAFLAQLGTAEPYWGIPGRTVEIPSHLQRIVREAGDIGGYDADALMNEYAELMISPYGEPIRDEIATVDDKYPKVFEFAQALLDGDPSDDNGPYGQIMLDYDKNGDQYIVTGAKRPSQPLVLVELEHGMDIGDPDNPIELTFLGETHSEAMGRNLRGPRPEAIRHKAEGLFSANTMVFKMNNAKVVPFRGVTVERARDRERLHRSRHRDDEQG